jgi:pilus assembly protein CpaB
MARRTLLLTAAFLVAALGTTLVFLYVQRVDDRALEDQQPRRVLVVKTLIGQGTSVAEAERAGAFELRDVASSSVAPGALGDLTPVRNLVALAPLFPGEQVLQAKFGNPGSASALALPAGKIAVSVQLGDPARVAGFVQPGSEVALFASLSVPVSGKTTQVTNVLLPRVTVIAVGPSTVTQATQDANANPEALPRALMTLALSQSEAQRVIFADGQGELYFGLLDKQSKTGKGSPTTLQNLFL